MSSTQEALAQNQRVLSTFGLTRTQVIYLDERSYLVLMITQSAIKILPTQLNSDRLFNFP